MVQVGVDTLTSAMQSDQSSSSSQTQTVMWVTLIVWAGLFFYLFYLDRQIKRVKERVEVDVEE